MCDFIKKRNGRKVPFDPQKILRAVERAYTAAGCEMTDFVRITVQDQSMYKGVKTVEDVQDIISSILFTSAGKKVYDAYTSYRAMRAELREKRKKRDFDSIVNIEINDITNDNGNMNGKSPAGQMMKFAAETTKAYSKDNLLAPDVRSAMDDSYIYVHDLDYMPTKSTTCVQTPLDKVLTHGMFAGHGEIRPAKRIETAVVVAAISLETTQNEQHGGQAIPAFDFYMAPYVRKTFEEEIEKIGVVLGWDEAKLVEYKDYPIAEYDPKLYTNYVRIAVERTVNRVHQAMESFIHNCNNIHSRGGNQVVFSSVNYGTDTSAEGRLVIREMLKCTMQGVGNGATAIFPIQVFKCKIGVNMNPSDPNYDLYKESWPVAARRFFPNYLNLDASYNYDDKWDASDPKRYEHEVATMGCRTRVYDNRFSERCSIGRGNLSFTSINLPKLAIETAIETGFYIKTKDGYTLTSDPDSYKEDAVNNRAQIFLSKLKKYADMVAKQLDDRYKFQATALKEQFPLLMSGIWKDSDKLQHGDTVEAVLKHGTLGVSFIGLAETLIMLTGKHHGESEKSNRLGMQIIEYLAGLCKGYANEYDHNYSCFATPAEGLSGRFTVADRKKFGIIEHVTDKDYYTNSSHVPVWYKCTPKHKAEVECPYHKYELAGHIFYVEADADITKNPEAIDSVVRLGMAHDGGYISINHSQGRCKHCNYEDNNPDLHMGDECPHCHQAGGWNLLQRTTGYLVGTFDKQTFGKQAEIKDRIQHVKH